MKIPIHLLFSFSLLQFTCILSFAQQTKISDRISLKINISLAHAEPLKYNEEIVQINYKPQFGLAFGYECLPNLDAGIYFAYSNLTHMVEYKVNVVDGRVMSSSLMEIPSRALYYGIELKYHLLPWLLKGKNLRFDIYPIAIGGFVSRSWNELNGTHVSVRNHPEYHAGLGLGYKFNKHIGLNCEYTSGSLYNEGRSKASLGFLISF